MEIYSFVMAILLLLALLYGGNNIARYNYFIKMNLPKILRKVLFLPGKGKISLASIIYQFLIIIIFTIWILNWFGINVLSPFGDFDKIFAKIITIIFLFAIPFVIYTILVCVVFSKKN